MGAGYLSAALRGEIGMIGGPLQTPVVFFDDFIEGGATTETNWGHFSDTANVGDWLVSKDTLVAATQMFTVQDAADGGWVKATTDATSGERISAQVNGEAFTMSLRRQMYFETRVKFTNVTQDAFMGLAISATDPHASRPAGFVAFTLTGDADIEYATGNASTATASADSSADLVANTFVVLSFHWDGISAVTFYVDGVKKAVSTATLPTGLALSPIMCVESNGAAEAMFIDYVLAINERS